MSRYHIPRTWVHPGENLLVIHEELGGDPSKISLITKTGQDICSFVSEADPPPVDSWKPNLGVVSSSPQVRLACERGWHIAAINFASYGIPEGNCGSFRPGACHMDVLPIVQKVTLFLPIRTCRYVNCHLTRSSICHLRKDFSMKR